jgi:hypothetical protein
MSASRHSFDKFIVDSNTARVETGANNRPFVRS